jgi:hypothetical protein
VRSDDTTEPSDAFGVFWTSLPQRIGVFHPSYQNELQKAPTAPQVRAPPLSWWGAAKHVLAPAADRVGEVGGATRPHLRFAPPLIRFIPGSLTRLAPLFLKRRRGRTLGGAAVRARPGLARVRPACSTGWREVAVLRVCDMYYR